MEKFAFFPDEIIGSRILARQEYGYQVVRLCGDILDDLGSSSINLIDVGANIGVFSRQLKSLLGDKLLLFLKSGNCGLMISWLGNIHEGFDPLAFINIFFLINFFDLLR